MELKILKFIDDEPRISHRVIAEKVFEFDNRKKGNEEIQLKNRTTQIKELITDNIEDFEYFGHLRFETETVTNSVGAINKQKTYFLNEQQATLLMTYLRNTKVVRNFKKQLVKEFYEMRMQLQKVESQKPEISISETLSKSVEILHLIQLLKEQNIFDLFLLDGILENESPTKLLKIDFSQKYFLPTELGFLKGMSGAEMNQFLFQKGFQIRENEKWVLTEKGREFGIEIGGKFSQLKWKLEALK
jgi:phage regulator Rha-like protein